MSSDELESSDTLHEPGGRSGSLVEEPATTQKTVALFMEDCGVSSEHAMSDLLELLDALTGA